MYVPGVLFLEEARRRSWIPYKWLWTDVEVPGTDVFRKNSSRCSEPWAMCPALLFFSHVIIWNSYKIMSTYKAAGCILFSSLKSNYLVPMHILPFYVAFNGIKCHRLLKPLTLTVDINNMQFILSLRHWKSSMRSFSIWLILIVFGILP